MKRLMRYLAVSAAMFACLSVAAVPRADADEARLKGEADRLDQDESWEVILIGGQRVGHVQTRSWTSLVAGAERHWSESVSRMTIKRFGGSLTMTMTQVTEEDADGNLLTFRHETDNPPISSVRVSGTVAGETLHLKRSAAGETKETTSAWEPDVKSPAWQERRLSQEPLAPGETLTFKTFEPQFLKVAEITLRGEMPAKTALLDGTERRLSRMTMSHSLIPGVEMTLYLDEEGNTLKSESPLMQMVTYTVSKAEALASSAGSELDLAVKTLVPVEPIPNAHRSRRLVYELRLDRPQLTVDIPTGLTQTVEQIDEQTYRLSITAIRPDSKAEGPTTQTVGDEYLRTSRQLECGHPAVVKLAESAAAGLSDPVETALAMERWVHTNLKSKNFSTALATAAEVARTLEGDCTEHAVLLAAMLRVRQIPSRIAVGLVYVDSYSAFGGHMWTEAFLDGRWVPLDATLGQGGIGAGHLKFADSSLSDDAPPPITTFLPLIGLLEHMHLRVVASE